MQRHRLPGGKHQALELQGHLQEHLQGHLQGPCRDNDRTAGTMLQITTSHQISMIHEKYLQQNDRAQGYRLAITGRCVSQEQDLSTW
jgi:hypothetical protein